MFQPTLFKGRGAGGFRSATTVKFHPLLEDTPMNHFAQRGPDDDDDEDDEDDDEELENDDLGEDDEDEDDE